MRVRSYIVDDTASDSGALCMEPAVSAQLEADYGIVPDIVPGHNAETDAFFADLVAIFQVSSARYGRVAKTRQAQVAPI